MPELILPAGGVGNLIAAPLYKPVRDNGATVFLDPGTLEPHKDQWAYLSALGRMSPREVAKAAERAGRRDGGIGGEAARLAGLHGDAAGGRSGHSRPARLRDPGGAGGADTRPCRDAAARGLDAQSAVLRAAAHPGLHLGVPRFLYSFDETIDGGLILPRGMIGTITSLVEEAGSRLEITDERSAGSPQEFTFKTTLT